MKEAKGNDRIHADEPVRVDPLAVRIPFTAEERTEFERHVVRRHIVRGAWVKEAVLEKLARERRAELEAVRG